jgi:hypothetical protein
VRPEHPDPLSDEELGATLDLLQKVERVVAVALRGRPARPGEVALLRVTCHRIGEILAATAKRTSA